MKRRCVRGLLVIVLLVSSVFFRIGGAEERHVCEKEEEMVETVWEGEEEVFFSHYKEEVETCRQLILLEEIVYPSFLFTSNDLVSRKEKRKLSSKDMQEEVLENVFRKEMSKKEKNNEDHLTEALISLCSVPAFTPTTLEDGKKKRKKDLFQGKAALGMAVSRKQSSSAFKNKKTNQGRIRRNFKESLCEKCSRIIAANASFNHRRSHMAYDLYLAAGGKSGKRAPFFYYQQALEILRQEKKN